VSTPHIARLVGDIGTLMLAGPLYVGAGLAMAPLCILRPPSATALRRSQRGAVLIATAGLRWGIDNKVTARIDHPRPRHITLLHEGLAAGAANLVLGIAMSRATWPSGSTVLTSLLIDGVGYGLSITLWVTRARYLGATRGQVILATAPFIGAIVAWRIGVATDSTAARALVRAHVHEVLREMVHL
jgi:drug/metabolite transporter (DMT)-like permease